MTSRTRIPTSEDRLTRTPAHQESAPGEGPGLAESQNPILQLQRQRGNQYVLRMLSDRAAASGAVQRDDDEQQPSDSSDNSTSSSSSASNSMVGDFGDKVGGAVDWLSGTLGMKGMGGKIKQGIDKTQETVNSGIDWGIDKVRGGVKKVEDWVEN